MIKLAQKYGTPLYVYDADGMRARMRELKRHLKGADIYYACKANPNPVILALIESEGLGIEAVSPGELAFAKHAGFPKGRISFTCSSAAEEDLVFAAKSAGTVHIDSLVQLEAWGRLKLGREVSIRLNQGIGAGHHKHTITGGPDSKFGIGLKDIAKAKEIATRYNLRITGIQQHIGSGILDVSIFMRAVSVLLKTAEQFPDIAHIDFGGGFGVPYNPNDTRLNLAALGKEWQQATKAFQKKMGREISLAFEPGRYIVAEAGTLLVSVVDKKPTEKHVFVGVNSGMNHLIRPAMYGSYHNIENLSRPRAPKEKVSIVGNVCESSDFFASGRMVGTPEIGDVLAIRNAGAYGMSMASAYNLRALPKEILYSTETMADITYDRVALLTKLLRPRSG